MDSRILILFSVTFYFLSSFAFAQEKLVFSIDLIRHGDRTPVSEIPKSPYEWKEGLSALTEKGATQEFQLGQQLRKEYVDQSQLLPEIYERETLMVRSTDIERTKASARYFLKGLYPFDKRPKVNQAPANIPIQTVKKENDHLLLAKPNKSPIASLKIYFWEKNYWKEKTNSIQHKLQHWREVTGLGLENFDQLGLLADHLYIRKISRIPFPLDLTQQEADEIIALGENAVVDQFKLVEVSGPMGNLFLDTVVQNFQLAIENKTKLKSILFFGHDSSILSVMTMLGTPLSQVPTYASRLNFSLFENDKNYFIRVSFNGTLIHIPRCRGTECQISELK